MHPILFNPLEATRLRALASAILWGNAHFNPNVGLAVAPDGRAYTVNNLQYSAALLEAAAEQREIGIERTEAISRANAILARLFAQVSVGGQVPRDTDPDAPPLPRRLIAQAVVSVADFLDRQGGRLSLSPEATSRIRPALSAMLRTVYHRPPGAPTAEEGAAATDAALLSRYRSERTTAPHWAQLTFTELDPPSDADWTIPPPRPAQLVPFGPCKDITCYLARHQRGADPAKPPDDVMRYIETRCYKGDWTGQTHNLPFERRPPVPPRPAQPVLPVILVSGLEVQLLHRHPSGPGFSAETTFRLNEPPPRGGGRHDHAPTLTDIDVKISPEDRFDGLHTKLTRAGYDHVRFRQSQPSGDIQIASDELYAVIDKTKELYSVDKVILVCHSRGGVIARRCILDRWIETHTVDVAKLITYGSPHLGAVMSEHTKQIIMDLTLSTLPGVGMILDDTINLIGHIPGVGNEIKTRVRNLIVGIVEDVAQSVWDGLAAFFASGEQLDPHSDFMRELNDGYGAPFVPTAGGQHFSLWQAIDHVLIAGTRPDFFRVYMGSWLPRLAHHNVAELLADIANAETPDGVSGLPPAPYWNWNWNWHPILRFATDFSRLALGQDAVPEYQDGLGDGVVEKQSALARGITGQIRRVEFELNHFTLKTSDQVTTTYPAPGGSQLSVLPWQLLFSELELPYTRTSGCADLSRPGRP